MKIGAYMVMTPRERELLQGMGNCYVTCRADFEDTIRMVGGSRGLDPEQVRQILASIREKYADDPDYRKLRGRLPEEFPM